MSASTATIRRMEYIYALRQGNEDIFKIGHAADVETRRKALRTGNPALTAFDRIETDDGRDGERFIHKRLDAKRLGGEWFAVTADEASEAMQACRDFLEHELPKLKKERGEELALKVVESGPEMLPSSEDLVSKYRELRRLRAEKWRIEIEEERLVLAIKLAIGTAKGIEGVATWETRDCPRFDNARFKADHPDTYESYVNTQRVRHFRLSWDS